MLKDIPDLAKHYPNFSLAVIVSLDDFANISAAIKNHNEINFNYDIAYNLEQLQNIPFQNLLDNNNLLSNDRVGIIKFYDSSAFGQYKIKGKDNQNQFVFNQKKFISNDKERLNYLSKMLNDTTPIRAFNGSYRKFLIMSKDIPSVKFKKTDFPTEDLVKEIYVDNNVFNINKENILEDWHLNFIMQNMPTLFDDLDIDVSLVKAVLTSEIKSDPAMNYVYGSDSRTYNKDMLVVNVKTTLKIGNIFSDVTIDEQLALKISYV